MNHSNGKNRSRSISRDREKQKQVQQPQKMIQQKQQIPSLFSSKMDEEGFIKNMEKSGMKYLDDHQETRRNGDYLFYCVNCECKLRNNWHLQDHIRTGEHLAKTNRVNDRAFLRDTFAKLKDKIGCPTTDHIQALDILSASIQNNSDFMHDECIQKRDIQQILVALEKTLQNEFGSNIDKGEQAVKLEITGSFLTELHVAKENICDLNIYAQFHEGLEKSRTASFLFNGCFEAIKKICRHLPKSNPLSPARKIVHYGAPIIRIQLFFDQFSYFLNLGIGKQAEKAHYSTRFVLAYLHIWPPLRRLIRFVRYWAEINHLTFQSCAGITNYAFDILCIFYLQRIGYLPILNEFIKEILTNEEYNKIQIPVKNVVELCQLPEEKFFDACRTFRHLYYGERIPNLSDGKMIQGFFKYFATEFDLHNKCDITSHELTNKPYCEKHFILIDPFIECNILRLRLEGEAYFWNCIIKTATYLCIPQTPKGPLINILFSKSEFDMKKIKISFLRIKTNTFEWNQGAMRMIQSGECPIEYNFNMLNFQPGEIPQIICQHCNLRGHCDWDCHLVRPCSSYGLIPPIRANLRNNLTNAIMEIYKDGILTKKRAAKIANYINELKKILTETFGVDDLSLTPFGSVVNGFGMNDCDLDLCLQSAKINQQIQTQEIIEKMDKKLRSLGYKTQTIFLAKVPIIKFQEPKNNFRGDISIGNCLGLKNSDLLKTYTEFDHRVAPLGLFIKRLFKLHNLNDSPNGSFSSYSIIIMLIAYLQRGCDPPVLPFLQELTKDENPREMLEGWDVTFEHHPTNKCLPEAKLNKQTLAELFIGFLHYFLGKFDPKMDVVQIRQSAPLFKMDKTNGNKRWDQYTFCVEDPFDLNHNLCGGIKQDVLLQFFTLLRSVLNELALLDKKQEKNTQWANENGTQQQERTSTLSELLKNMGEENNNKLSVMPKLFGFL